MPPGPEAQRIKAQLVVWWTIWSTILAALGLIYLLVARGRPLPAPSASDFLINLSGFVPLFVSIVLRWLVLPRSPDPTRAFVVFVFGLVLAEGGGVLGIFRGGPYRDALLLLGVLGIIQYAPFYAKKLFEAKAVGFIPNN